MESYAGVGTMKSKTAIMKHPTWQEMLKYPRSTSKNTWEYGWMKDLLKAEGIGITEPTHWNGITPRVRLQKG